MEFSWQVAVIWLAAYLIGAIPFGYLIARARGVDIFAQGSGNIGATNVGRVLGRRFGILVFLLDFAKGALPVLGALFLRQHYKLGGDPIEVGAGLAAFLGHLFPVYLGFRGGKGVATGAGVVAVLVPGPMLGAALTWLVVVAATRFVSLASVAAALALCGLQVTIGGGPDFLDPRNVFCLLAAALIVIRHRTNLVRLVQGNENRLKESAAMTHLAKSLHVLSLGLWFGMCIFFTFVVTLSLFATFEAVATHPAAERPAWFPLAPEFRHIDTEVNGPKEQGSRAAGYAVGPMFHWYYLLQGVCGLVAVFTALSWSRTYPQKVHRLRAWLLLAGLVLVLIGWPLERRVSELRVPRNQAMDAYLQAADPGTLAAMKDAKGEFFRWHTYSLLANFGVVIAVTLGMALAARLPPEAQPASVEA